jgi:hypothetical protein
MATATWALREDTDAPAGGSISFTTARCCTRPMMAAQDGGDHELGIRSRRAPGRRIDPFGRMIVVDDLPKVLLATRDTGNDL